MRDDLGDQIVTRTDTMLSMRLKPTANCGVVSQFAVFSWTSGKSPVFRLLLPVNSA